MKRIYCIALIAAVSLLAPGGPASAQGLLPRQSDKCFHSDSLSLRPLDLAPLQMPVFGPGSKSKLILTMPLPPMATLLPRAWSKQEFLLYEQTEKDSVMAPDRMICRLPRTARMEKMPVAKLQNVRPVDRMPNGF